MILVVLFVSIASVATLNFAQLKAYTVNVDAICRQYFFFQGKEHYMYFFGTSANRTLDTSSAGELFRVQQQR